MNLLCEDKKPMRGNLIDNRKFSNTFSILQIPVNKY